MRELLFHMKFFISHCGSGAPYRVREKKNLFIHLICKRITIIYSVAHMVDFVARHLSFFSSFILFDLLCMSRVSNLLFVGSIVIPFFSLFFYHIFNVCSELEWNASHEKVIGETWKGISRKWAKGRKKMPVNHNIYFFVYRKNGYDPKHSHKSTHTISEQWITWICGIVMPFPIFWKPINWKKKGFWKA